MLLSENPTAHLTYCMNIHPGERWPEVFHAIRTYPQRVRTQVLRQHPELLTIGHAGSRCASPCGNGIPESTGNSTLAFGLGLRMGKRAADDLQREGGLGALRYLLEADNLYPYTINGFPYGAFHGLPVKADVYRPDWRDPARRDYTCQLADILAVLLPAGGEGSISSVPCAYGGQEVPDTEIALMVRNLMAVVIHLAGIYERTRKTIHIGLEPEPDCYLERTQDCIAFFTGPVCDVGIPCLVKTAGWCVEDAKRHIAKHLGVCFDTCHLAVWYEDLAESVRDLQAAGIRISKVQLSSALATTWGQAGIASALEPFCDRVYLHQVKLRDPAGGSVTGYRDLPDLLATDGAAGKGHDLRVHFHVPLYWDGDGLLGSTNSALTPGFFRAARAAGVTHWEIETYTFNVLPRELRALPVEDSIAMEYDWVIARMGGNS